MKKKHRLLITDPLACVGTGGEISDVNAFLSPGHRYYLRAKMYFFEGVTKQSNQVTSNGVTRKRVTGY